MKEKYSIKRRETPYVVAHRGVCGANVPCNTLAAFETAIRQGADMIELDVSKSADGELFIFHPGMERRFIRIEKRLTEMTGKEIKELRLVNMDGERTSYAIPTLRETLECLKDRVYINVDKFWTDVEGISKEIKRAGVERQVVVKTYPDEKAVDAVERYAPDYMFMAMLRKEDKLTKIVKERNINYIGAEVLFDSDNDPIISDEYVADMHAQGLLVWGNGIVYDERDVISAGHNDDISVRKDPALGWGWLVDKKVDFIQTDWTLALKQYLHARKANP